MGYITRQLLANEKILFTSRIHRIIFVAPIFWTFAALILLAMSHFMSHLWHMLTIVASVAAIIYWPSALIKYFFSEYVLTNKRVLVKIGFIWRQSLELFLQKIEGIQVDQHLLGRLLGYGTIIIFGVGGTHNRFQLIHQPLVFRRKVQRQIEDMLQSKK